MTSTAMNMNMIDGKHMQLGMVREEIEQITWKNGTGRRAKFFRIVGAACADVRKDALKHLLLSPTSTSRLLNKVRISGYPHTTT